ncbi:hypothetical protein C8R47DRAFT_1141067 [Mycena vitilis]|nr:hypothetical protein C8R47DRAFT_1141067 [Mycena vitilis]
MLSRTDSNSATPALQVFNDLRFVCCLIYRTSNLFMSRSFGTPLLQSTSRSRFPADLRVTRCELFLNGGSNFFLSISQGLLDLRCYVAVIWVGCVTFKCHLRAGLQLTPAAIAMPPLPFRHGVVRNSRPILTGSLSSACVRAHTTMTTPGFVLFFFSPGADIFPGWVIARTSRDLVSTKTRPTTESNSDLSVSSVSIRSAAQPQQLIFVNRHTHEIVGEIFSSQQIM